MNCRRGLAYEPRPLELSIRRLAADAERDRAGERAANSQAHEIVRDGSVP